MTETRAQRSAANRRANGEGTIYRANNGRWCAQLPPDPRTGKRREFWGATQAEAMDRRDAHRTREARFGEVPDDDPTLSAYLCEWLEHTAAPRVRPGTLADYRLNVTGRIVPELGRLRLSAIRPVDVRRMMDAIARRTSPRTANLARAVLRKALEDARRDRVLIGDNPAALASSLKQPHREHRWLEAGELHRLLAALNGHPLRPLFVLAAVTGMRQGELIGTRWRDLTLDDEAPALAVRGQLQWLDREPVLVEPKTHKSARVIPLAEHVAALLKAHRTAQTRRRLLLGPLWSNTLELVFTTDNGAPLTRTMVAHAFRKALRSAGLPMVRFHDLRHSAATLMLERSGGDLKAVSTTLGHSTITLTANTYAHAGARVVGRTVALLDDLAGPAIACGT